MLYFLFSFCLSFLLGLPASPSAEPLSGHLTLAGSSTVQPVAETLGQEFEKQHPEVRIDVHGGGSAVGIVAPQTGLADIGMVSRALRDEETQRLHATPFARDGIALIAHASNLVSGLSRQQVIDIYSGQVTDWQSVGGPKSRIIVVNKEEGRATSQVFTQYFDLTDNFVQDALIIGPNGQAIITVAGNPHALAYVSIGAAEVAVSQGVAIKLLALDGVAAATATVQDGTYQLARTLNLVTAGPPDGVAKAFLDFVVSPAGQQIAAQHEFVPARRALAQIPKR
jgi:phosphate transport system substrate-binding protein